MGANDHPLYLSSPDSRSSSSSSLTDRRSSKSFFICDILKTNFGPSTSHESISTNNKSDLLPAWLFCTRYSDRPSAGPRTRKSKGYESNDDSKRPRTAFTSEQLERLKEEFNRSKYLTGERRQILADQLGLNESQVKIWYQNKRAKMKKNSGVRNTLALQLMAQGLYNHRSSGNEKNG